MPGCWTTWASGARRWSRCRRASVGAVLALKYPERVQSLVLLSCGVRGVHGCGPGVRKPLGRSAEGHFPVQTPPSTGPSAPRAPRHADEPHGRERCRHRRADARTATGRGPGDRTSTGIEACGVDLDNRAAMPDARIAGIRAPTLAHVCHRRHASALPQRRVCGGHILGARACPGSSAAGIC